MSTVYENGWAIRYGIPKLSKQAEFAVVTAADQIKNEDPGTANHENRIAWAGWIDHNSAIGVIAFMWPLALNPSIQNSVESDPSGESIPDTDVQFVVNSNLEFVIEAWVASQSAV